MPELPEVETVRLNLINLVINKKISNVEILDSRIPSKSPLELKNLISQQILNIHRLGKYLFFEFNDFVMISHLRMEGKYYFYEEEEIVSSHARIIFTFEDKTKLVYDDVRRFGIMELYKKEDVQNSKTFKSIGKEPFQHTLDTFFPLMKKSNLPIKNVLLDQHIISGIGNIYADEILFRCKLSPFKKANTLTPNDAQSILDNARLVLNEAIKQGGSTIKSYHPGRNIDGKFQQKLLVYNKKGEKCINCHATLLKSFLNGRGTTYCPNCQNVGKVIGIYGKIAAGKSTFLNFFKEDNFPIFSADEEVNKIYKDDFKFVAYCIKNFGEEVLNENNKVSKEYIKQIVFNDLEKKKILENYIHPEIKNRAISFIKNHRDDKLIILEIPLLFESKMNTMCDYIIGLDVSLDIQIRNLKNRKSKNVNMDIILNSTSIFDKVTDKLDFIVHNDSTLENLKENYEKVKSNLLKI